MPIDPQIMDKAVIALGGGNPGPAVQEAGKVLGPPAAAGAKTFGVPSLQTGAGGLVGILGAASKAATTSESGETPNTPAIPAQSSLPEGTGENRPAYQDPSPPPVQAGVIPGRHDLRPYDLRGEGTGLAMMNDILSTYGAEGDLGHQVAETQLQKAQAEQRGEQQVLNLQDQADQIVQDKRRALENELQARQDKVDQARWKVEDLRQAHNAESSKSFFSNPLGMLANIGKAFAAGIVRDIPGMATIADTYLKTEYQRQAAEIKMAEQNAEWAKNSLNEYRALIPDLKLADEAWRKESIDKFTKQAHLMAEETGNPIYHQLADIAGQHLMRNQRTTALNQSVSTWQAPRAVAASGVGGKLYGGWEVKDAAKHIVSLPGGRLIRFDSDEAYKKAIETVPDSVSAYRAFMDAKAAIADIHRLKINGIDKGQEFLAAQDRLAEALDSARQYLSVSRGQGVVNEADRKSADRYMSGDYLSQILNDPLRAMSNFDKWANNTSRRIGDVVQGLHGIPVTMQVGKDGTKHYVDDKNKGEFRLGPDAGPDPTAPIAKAKPKAK